MDTHSGEHAGRNGNCCPESCHAFQETAESETDEQDEDPGIRTDGGEHRLDDIHALGVDGQMIGVNRGSDDEQDGPEGEGGSFECCCEGVFPGHAEELRACKKGYGKCDRAGLPGGHFQSAQGNDEPENRQ